jgi:hypothetical protein
LLLTRRRFRLRVSVLPVAQVARQLATPKLKVFVIRRIPDLKRDIVQRVTMSLQLGDGVAD